MIAIQAADRRRRSGGSCLQLMQAVLGPLGLVVNVEVDPGDDAEDDSNSRDNVRPSCQLACAWRVCRRLVIRSSFTRVKHYTAQFLRYTHEHRCFE